MLCSSRQQRLGRPASQEACSRCADESIPPPEIEKKRGRPPRLPYAWSVFVPLLSSTLHRQVH